MAPTTTFADYAMRLPGARSAVVRNIRVTVVPTRDGFWRCFIGDRQEIRMSVDDALAAIIARV